MPRLKPAPRSNVFDALANEELARTENRSCAVFAVAAACGISYTEAHEAMRLAGRKAKRGTPMYVTKKALASLGFNLRRWTASEMVAKVQSYPIRAAGITTHHPHRLHASWKNEGTLLFRTAGHILCVKDGVNHDWSNRNSLRVIEVYSVEKI